MPNFIISVSRYKFSDLYVITKTVLEFMGNYSIQDKKNDTSNLYPFSPPTCATSTLFHEKRVFAFQLNQQRSTLQTMVYDSSNY